MKKKIYLIRHGETAWTLSGQHTGTTDLPLTHNGEKQAESIGIQLKGISFEKVLCSPLKRATQTCALAQLPCQASTDDDLKEWNYGEYEGLTTPEIWKKNPDWNIFSNGAPNGERVEDVSLRAERIIKQLLSVEGNCAIFSHGHFLRILTARWLELLPREGKHFSLSPGSLSILGYERATPALLLWNRLHF